ncbi:InlB B-repeat-containing protein [Cohnella fermenti]|uniref:InlB B-repeat-containing protein n=1 Tax=Cohnella fermenti TaxID=2565925 RepID=UPI001E33B308|nr:InlB B-repeat-containing protein [Cohnella fermenti]
MSSTAWYAPYVQWAVENGITSGTGSDTFSPDETLSREMMATLTLRYFENASIAYQADTPITTLPNDLADTSPWAADAVTKLWQAGVITGDEHGNLNPKSSATRAEAAVFCMRANEVVKASANQQVDPESSASLEASENAGSGGGGSGGGEGGGDSGDNGAAAYTITFESNGGSAIASLKLNRSDTLSGLPAPGKQGFIFQGWYYDSDFTQVVVEGAPVTGDTTLYANYITGPDRAVESIPSVTVLDQAPTFTIDVIDATGSMTAAQVQEGMTFEAMANPAFAGIVVTGANGRFTVASAAQDGEFEEGNTYQLTLTDKNLSYKGQDAATAIYVFSIAKQAVLNVPLNPDMIYLAFSDVSNMMLNGEEVDSPAIPVIATELGGAGSKLSEANVGSGTFEYAGSTAIQEGDIVAIYEGVRPDLRSVETTESGEVAYVQIAAIEGNTYTYTHADSKAVLAKPDILPVSMEADTDGDETNLSIRVAHDTMNYSDSRYAPLGLSELTVVNEGDFIAFYNGEFDSHASLESYGLITSITHDAEMDIITYTDAALEQITSALNVYQQQALDGEQLLSDESVAVLEGQVKQQAVASGFVVQAADYLSEVAVSTASFKEEYVKIASLSSTSVASKIDVENLTVVPAITSTLTNLTGSGVSVSLQVGADVVIHMDDESDIVIHLTAAFIEEIRMDLSINGDTQIGWYWIFPYVQDYIITANLDAYTFTGINITAEIATVANDELEDALEDWLDAKTSGKLGKVRDIATELKALIDGVQDTGVDAKTLKMSYRSLLENETEWVPLINQSLIDRSLRVCLGIVEINFSVDFVVSANVNLSVGADFNYKSAKRYSAAVRILSFTGSSNTVSLPGDGDYQFKLYVLGTLGLRAGVEVTLQAGIGSVKWDSIGISVEPGVYLNLWGYFYYDLQKSGSVQTSESLGALYVELGIYLESQVGAQLGDGLLSGDVTLYDNTWPLFSVGSEESVDDFAYQQNDTLAIKLSGDMEATKSMVLPASMFTMSVMDLRTGDTYAKAFDKSNYTITVDNADFTYDSRTNTLKPTDSNKSAASGTMTVRWNNAPLAFTSTPIQRTYDLTWLKYSGKRRIVLNTGNGGLATYILAEYKDKIVAPADPERLGYTFEGWYTDATGGTKYVIPDTMPGENVILYARWALRTDMPYTIEHYWVDPNSGAATLAATESLTGTAFSTFTPANTDRFKAQGYVYTSYASTGASTIVSRNADGDVTKTSVYINGYGTTVVKVYYVRDTRVMTFNAGYAGGPTFTKSLQIGQNFTWRPSISRPGYTLVGWFESDGVTSIPGTVPGQDTAYTAKWQARTDTSYKVVYLQQNMAVNNQLVPVLSNTYTIVDQQEYSGTTDTATITAKMKDYEGFTFDSSNPATLLSSTISGDGSTVLRLYYTRNTYKVTYDLDGRVFVGDTDDPYVFALPYGAAVGSIGAINKAVAQGTGEILTGWTPSLPTTVPAHDMTVVAQWSAKLASYTVTHYRPDTTGQYTIIEKMTLSGPVDETVTAATKSYEGFSIDSAVVAAVASGTVIDSTTSPLELKLYYKRNVYTATLDLNGGTVYAGTSSAKTGTYTPSILYGYSLPSMPVTRAGYVFAGWSPALPDRMPAGNISSVAQWEPDYTITSVSIDHTEPAIGDTLNAEVIMGDGQSASNRVTYQWKVETEASGTYVNAAGTGNTTASYTVAAADAGKRLQVAVTGVSPITGTRSATTHAVSVPISEVTIDNVYPVYGDTLTASATLSDGSAAGSSVTYQWKVETEAGETYENAAGDGNTTASYTVAAADVGKQLQVVASYMGRAAGAATSEATHAVGVSIARVAIDNPSPRIGDILTAAATMADGTSAGDRATYEWMAEDIAGSGVYVSAAGAGRTTASYTVAAADAGKKLQVWAIGAKEGLGMAISEATDAVQAAAFEPLPEWIASAEALDLESATVTVVSATEVSISGAALTDDWALPEDVTLNMSDMTLNGHTLTLAAGATLNVSDSTMDGNIEAEAGSTLNVSNTTIDEGYYWNIREDAALNVSGTVTLAMAASLIVDGTAAVLSSATVNNNGTITGYSGTGVITNDGTITNNSSIMNSGTLTNNGTIINTAGAIWSNFGTFAGNDPIAN